MTMKIGTRIRIEVVITGIGENCHVAEPYIHCSYLGGKDDLVQDILCQLSKPLLGKF